MPDARETFLEAFGDGNPFLCSLATVGPDGAPRVRFVRAKTDQTFTLRIPTFAETQKTRHIRGESRIHITCGDTDSNRPGTYFQIDGTAEVTSALAEREAAWTPRLSTWFSGPDDPKYVVVKVRPAVVVALPIGRAGEAAVWRARID